MAERPPFLGKILIDKGLISKEELEDALRVQEMNKEFLGAILLRRGVITEQQLYECLSQQSHLPLVHINDKELNWALVDMFTKSLILEHNCIPIEEKEGKIIFAVSDPLDAWVVSEAEQQAKGHQIERVLTFKNEMDDALNKYRQHMKDKIKKLFGG